MSDGEIPLVDSIPVGTLPDDAQIKDLAQYYQENPPSFGSMIGAWARGSGLGRMSSDKQRIIEDILRYGVFPIRPQLRDENHLVDVGGGDGTILLELVNFFGKVIDIDSYKKNFDAVMKRFANRGIPREKLQCLEGDLANQEIVLKQQGLRGKIALILNIHNLYYLVYGENPQEKMTDVLRQSLNVLIPWGRSISVLKNPIHGATSKFYHKFHGRHFELDLIDGARTIQDENSERVEFKQYSRKVETIIQDVRDAFNAALLVLLHNDTPGTPERFNFTGKFEEILRYVVEVFYNPERGIFVFPQQQDHLIIKNIN